MIAFVAASKQPAETMGDAWLKTADATTDARFGFRSLLESGAFVAPEP